MDEGAHDERTRNDDVRGGNAPGGGTRLLDSSGVRTSCPLPRASSRSLFLLPPRSCFLALTGGQ